MCQSRRDTHVLEDTGAEIVASTADHEADVAGTSYRNSCSCDSFPSGAIGAAESGDSGATTDEAKPQIRSYADAHIGACR